MDLARLITVVRTYLWLILGSTILAVLAAYAVTTLLPKVYEGEARVVVGPGINGQVQDYNQLLSSLQLARTYAEAASTRKMAEEVIDALGLDVMTEDFREALRVETSRETPIVTIAADADSPELAAAIANEIATRLVAQSGVISGRDSEVEALVRAQIADLQLAIPETRDQIAALQAIPNPTAGQLALLASSQDRLVSLQATLAALLSSPAGSAGSVAILDPATEPLEASSPVLVVNLLIALLVGLIIGLLFAIGLTTLDDSLKTPADIQASLGLPVLGVIGRIRSASLPHPRYRLAMLLYPRSTVSEAFRKIRTSLSFTSVDKTVRSIVVTGAGRSEGKTTVAANLALAFAQNGTRTILVDADLRQSMMHHLFGVANDVGLSSALRSDGLSADTYLIDTEDSNLRLLPAGPVPPNPAELLGSKRMKAIIATLSSQADMVIIDSPPLLAVTDAALVATAVDGAVLVISAKRTKRANARSATSTIASVGGTVLGVVLVSPKGAHGAEAYDNYAYGDTEVEGTPAAVSNAR